MVVPFYSCMISDKMAVKILSKREWFKIVTYVVGVLPYILSISQLVRVVDVTLKTVSTLDQALSVTSPAYSN